MSDCLTAEAYCRSTFDMVEYQHLCKQAALRVGFSVSEIEVSLAVPLLCLQRQTQKPRGNIYISAGMHGDEPAGSLALIRMLYKDLLPREFNYVIFPLLNPEGMVMVTRDNILGMDINRDYRRFRTTEARAHHQHMQRLSVNASRFDLTLCLHEDWEARGFYLYEVTPNWEPGQGERIVAAVSQVAPVETNSVIDEHEAQNAIIRPKERPTLQGDDWPEALYLWETYQSASYTFETPSNTDLLCRIRAHTTAILAALETIH